MLKEGDDSVFFWCVRVLRGTDSLRSGQRFDVLFLDNFQPPPLDQSCLHMGTCRAGGPSRVGPIAQRSRMLPEDWRLARLAI